MTYVGRNRSAEKTLPARGAAAAGCAGFGRHTGAARLKPLKFGGSSTSKFLRTFSQPRRLGSGYKKLVQREAWTPL
ncbi:hypothetical protein Q7L38_10815 [Pseudomonas protegens]|uniref:hypothetical protein n=1 Tax=Pseudomonas protegens TaxID=380021 RepID=UPI0027536905|nr:hypothetical protein [Pseudomonas protegens]MDP9533065.1 hypothetical protein [Pseudomonas protegens]